MSNFWGAVHIGRLRFSYVIVYNQSLLYHLPNLSRLEEKHETR